MINLELNKKATKFAVASALPFVLLGSFMWLMAALSDNPVARVELYGCADPMYHYLGLPLTHIIYIFKAEGALETSDNWWALPMVDALLIAQWIIWAQLAVVVGRVVKRIRN
jgi:hypothetical protein